MDTSDQPSSILMKKFRKVTQFLSISIFINVVFITAFFLQRFETDQVSYAYKKSPVSYAKESKRLTNEEYFLAIRKSSYRELIAILADDTLLEQGYRKRDFALALLVHNHSFDLHRAIRDKNFSIRSLVFQSAEGKHEVKCFSGLIDRDYDEIMHFAVTESWPLTPQGLFHQLQKHGLSQKSLNEAFLVTKEFHVFESLFTQTGVKIPSNKLLELCIDYGWKDLTEFSEKQMKTQNFSLPKRRGVLLSCLIKGSQVAAEILLETDLSFAVQKLDDSLVLRTLDSLGSSADSAQEFCLELLKSYRSDAVWFASAEKLYSLNGQVPPDPIDISETLARFSKGQAVEIEPQETNDSAVRDEDGIFHVVLEGETLWNIARRYRVELEELVRVNALNDDQIQPGTKLLIP